MTSFSTPQKLCGGGFYNIEKLYMKCNRFFAFVIWATGWREKLIKKEKSEVIEVVLRKKENISTSEKREKEKAKNGLGSSNLGSHPTKIIT